MAAGKIPCWMAEMSRSFSKYRVSQHVGSICTKCYLKNFNSHHMSIISPT